MILQQKPLLGQLPDWSLFPQPVALWLENEGSGNKIFDSSGNQSKYLGELVATTWKAGKFDHSLYFAGGNDYVKLGIWDGGPKVTLFARVKFDQAIGSNEQIATADSSVTGERTFQWRRDGSGKLDFIPFVGGGTGGQVTGNTTLTSGVWWDVVAVNDGVQSHVYVNGVEDATPENSGAMDNDAAAWGMGIRASKSDWSAVTESLEGQVEFLVRWDDTLSPIQIAQLVYRSPYPWFRHEPVDLWSAAQAAPPAGNAGIMTTNTGFWGPTF